MNTNSNNTVPWWKKEVIYQIYPMSYCDSNDDGIGDLNGIISKLDYIKSLGVGAIWLSPVYSSPNVDNGYDISDYFNIHENYGTIEDMDRLIEQAKNRDIKIIMDLVINHTSNKHEWFEKSRNKIEPYKDYYIWRSGKNGKKPSNWSGFFGDDCWEYDDVRKEYYLHLFSAQQPDLNYYNEDVINAVMEIMRFWLDRGVAGFRCDVINILYKETLENGKWRPFLRGFEHYASRQGTHDILNRFNKEVFSKYNCFTVGETVFVNPEEAKLLQDPSRNELNCVFSFEHMETDCFYIKWFLRKFSPKRLFKTLTKWQNGLDWNTIYFENHDQPRSISRFGNVQEYHKESAKALAILLLCLRGTAFLFEGQEIGMTNFDFKNISKIRDAESIFIYGLAKRIGFSDRYRWEMIKRKGRDNARTPMQWNAQKNAGFSNAKPWLNVNENYKFINVENQENDETSVLSFYKRLIAFRNENSALTQGSFSEVYNKNDVYIFERKTQEQTLKIIVNLTDKEKTIPDTQLNGDIVFSSYEEKIKNNKLKAFEALILKY